MCPVSNVTEVEKPFLAQALTLLRSGELERGVAAYRAILFDNGRVIAPAVGLHARMLASSGAVAAAERLLEMAVEAGADICVSGSLPNGGLESVLAEYRGLFERGRINALMVSRYLKFLSVAGRSEEIAAVVGPDRIRVHQLAGEGGSTQSIDLATLTRSITDRLGPEHFQPRNQALQGSHRLRHLQQLGDPELDALLDAVLEQAEIYKGELGRPGALPWLPRRLGVESWAVVSHGEGYADPHIHLRGWITGVFYAAAPAAALTSGDGQGGLRIGRPVGVPQDAPGWPDLSIAPVPGRLVLMPSYATHWTQPLLDPGLRIAIAVDLVEQRG